jgi:hypothetical protein
MPSLSLSSLGKWDLSNCVTSWDIAKYSDVSLPGMVVVISSDWIWKDVRIAFIWFYLSTELFFSNDSSLI